VIRIETVRKTTKTVLFEKAFGVDIRNFHTTEDVNKFIAKVRGREIGIIEIKTPLVVRRGGIWPIIDYDIDRMVDEAIGR